MVFGPDKKLYSMKSLHDVPLEASFVHATWFINLVVFMQPAASTVLTTCCIGSALLAEMACILTNVNIY